MYTDCRIILCYVFISHISFVAFSCLIQPSRWYPHVPANKRYLNINQQIKKKEEEEIPVTIQVTIAIACNVQTLALYTIPIANRFDIRSETTRYIYVFLHFFFTTQTIWHALCLIIIQQYPTDTSKAHCFVLLWVPNNKIKTNINLSSEQHFRNGLYPLHSLHTRMVYAMLCVCESFVFEHIWLWYCTLALLVGRLYLQFSCMLLVRSFT